MAAVGAVSTVLWSSSTAFKSTNTSSHANPGICFLTKNQKAVTLLAHLSAQNGLRSSFHSSLKVASSSSGEFVNAVESAENIEEPETKVRFQRSRSLPGGSMPLSLLGTGYREKVFAIIGVKVYSAGLYINESIFSQLHAWKRRPAADLEHDSAFFNTDEY